MGINTTAALSWKNLAVFESSDLVRRLYKRRHGLELNAGTAREITTALAQGRQYFAELRSIGDWLALLSSSTALWLCRGQRFCF